MSVILVRFLRKLNFLVRFSKKYSNVNFIKISPVGTALFQADRRTSKRTDNHDEVNSRFSQVCETLLTNNGDRIFLCCKPLHILKAKVRFISLRNSNTISHNTSPLTRITNPLKFYIQLMPHFTPWKDLVPFEQEASWAPGPFWTGAENLAPTGIRSPDQSSP